MVKQIPTGKNKPLKCKKAELKSRNLAAEAEMAIQDDTKCICTKAVIAQLKKVHAPSILMALVALIMSQANMDHSQVVDWAEYFAGKKAVSRAMLNSGLLTLPFELLDNPVMQNIMSAMGFIYAMHIALRLKPGGGSNTAPVCSTWTWVNRYTSQRSEHRPLGSSTVASVLEANTMVARQMLILWLFCARKTYWVLEQPVNSLMEKHPRFVELCSHFNITRTTINMSDYGSESKKPSWLYSAHSWIKDIAKYKGMYGKKRVHKAIVTVYFNKDGKRCVHGGAALKASQAYPDGFGMAMRELYLEHRKELEEAATESLISVEDINVSEKDIMVQGLTGTDRWSDAKLKDVFTHLSKHF